MRSSLGKLAYAAAVVLVGCGEDATGVRGEGQGGSMAGAGTSAVEPVSFIKVQIALQASGCSEGGCHSPPTGQGGLELVDSPWENLVDAKVTGCVDPSRRRVVPGDPGRSYLLNKLRGVDMCGGERMPKGCDDTPSRMCMNADRIEAIVAWIGAGASR